MVKKDYGGAKRYYCGVDCVRRVIRLPVMHGRRKVYEPLSQIALKVLSDIEVSTSAATAVQDLVVKHFNEQDPLFVYGSVAKEFFSNLYYELSWVVTALKLSISCTFDNVADYGTDSPGSIYYPASLSLTVAKSSSSVINFTRESQITIPSMVTSSGNCHHPTPCSMVVTAREYPSTNLNGITLGEIYDVVVGCGTTPVYALLPSTKTTKNISAALQYPKKDLQQVVSESISRISELHRVSHVDVQVRLHNPGSTYTSYLGCLAAS